jgi:hypothetical protein
VSQTPLTCSRCGSGVEEPPLAGSPPRPWVACSHCGARIALPWPSELEGKYSWEVLRHFYPEPLWPRRLSPQLRRGLVAVFLAAALLLFAVAGIFGDLGVMAVSAPPQPVTGSVQALAGAGGPLLPVAGALVSLSGLAAGNVTLTGNDGHFRFAAVPVGDHALKVLAPGFRPLNVEIFLAPAFEAPANNATDLSLVLGAGNTSSPETFTYSPFPDLPTYLTLLFSAAILEASAGALCVGGALALQRERPPARAVVAGAAAVLAPFLGGVTGFLPLFQTVMPLALALGAIAAALGGAALAVLTWAGRPWDLGGPADLLEETAARDTPEAVPKDGSDAPEAPRDPPPSRSG